MLRLPDRPFNKRQLADELAVLDLPGFTGFARMSRELDSNGRAVLENGTPQKVPPYILIKSDDLTGPQKAAVAQVVANHIPAADPPNPSREENLADALDNAADDAARWAAMMAYLRGRA